MRAHTHTHICMYIHELIALLIRAVIHVFAAITLNGKK